MVNKNGKKPISNYELWGLLDATGFAISRLRQLELAQLDLSIEQAAMLKLIQTTRNGTTLRKIKDATLRQQNTISITVNRMTKMGLVAKEQKPGEREFRITCTQRGRDLLKKVPTTSLDSIFSVLAPNQKKLFAHTLNLLNEKARGMLVPNIALFTRYTGENASEIIEVGGEEVGLFSDYRLWTFLRTVRFTISRLRELELAHFGITAEQTSILKVLVDYGMPVRVKDLENATLRQHHSISSLVNRMTRSNLVAIKRKSGEKSRWIFITGRGRSLFSKMTTATIDITFGALSEKRKQELAACLHPLYATARNLLGVSNIPSFARNPTPK
jgi:DNA-binding MarR family transcriptional regulator